MGNIDTNGGNTLENREFKNTFPVMEQLRRGNVMAVECPSRAILQHITGRWGLLVLICLHSGTKRFKEIHRAIGGISERMLMQTLQQLESDQMIIRKSYPVVPPHVEYTLTDFGFQAALKMVDLVEWLEATLPEILQQKSTNRVSD